MTLSEAKMFVRNYGRFVDFFGEEVVSVQVAKYKVEDFSQREYVPLDGSMDRHYAALGYPVIHDRSRYPFKEYTNNGVWSREVEKPAREYRIPSRYQTSERDLLRDCLLSVYPFLEGFKMDVYSIDSPSEIYVKTEDGPSLYVPLDALKQMSWEIVVDRMISYWTQYYSGQSPEAEEKRQKQFAVLETATAKRLRWYLDNKCLELTSEDRKRVEDEWATAIQNKPLISKWQKETVLGRIDLQRKIIESVKGGHEILPILEKLVDAVEALQMKENKEVTA